MTPDQWKRAKQLFEAALDLEPAKRHAFLDAACQGNAELRAEVEQLLAEDEIAGGFMDEPLVSVQAKPLSAGRRLGPYEILSAVGAGGMGEVYRARDTRLRRVVAIKVLPGKLASNPKARLRFEREARAVASLSHPHICALYDVGHEDGVDYLVIEFLDGETLSNRLSQGPLVLGDLLKYAIEIADALDQAHRHGIIHRDLKPSNVMLTKSGAKLLDFGVAKQHRRAKTATTSSTLSLTTPSTGAGMVIGTLAYMSPEQARGEEIDARSDLFSLGSVVYEMATGERAFSGVPAAVVDALLNREPAPARETNTALPEMLEVIIGKALQKDRKLRYQTAAEMHDDLARLLQPREGELREKGAKQAPLLVLAVLALLALVLASVIFMILRD
jgi:serine/threonine protein kinase